MPDIRPMYRSDMARGVKGGVAGGRSVCAGLFDERGRVQLKAHAGSEAVVKGRRQTPALRPCLGDDGPCSGARRRGTRPGRCGLVAQPVAPTAPSVWPCSIDWPRRTSMRLRWHTRDVLVAVLDEHHVVVAALHARNSPRHRPRRTAPVGAWANRCPGRRHGLQDGVQAHLEAAGHARELDGEVR